ncbi:MAG: hypothetical protein QM526_00535 [Alphaproteobacteria bacterium]|nr:hypothetical protein [Alphaproteobacteria bacterium]
MEKQLITLFGLDRSILILIVAGLSITTLLAFRLDHEASRSLFYIGAAFSIVAMIGNITTQALCGKYYAHYYATKETRGIGLIKTMRILYMICFFAEAILLTIFLFLNV